MSHGNTNKFSPDQEYSGPNEQEYCDAHFRVAFWHRKRVRMQDKDSPYARRYVTTK